MTLLNGPPDMHICKFLHILMFLFASSQQMLDLSTAIASRLANLAQIQREDFQQLLSRYAREWLLYRLNLT